jgi:hypothetical protein
MNKSQNFKEGEMNLKSKAEIAPRHQIDGG